MFVQLRLVSDGRTDGHTITANTYRASIARTVKAMG